ncbi:MAG: patatin-like phospholipase family protein [Novosphingobium sp.]
MIRIGMVAALVALLGGCAISPPPTTSPLCNFTRYHLAVDNPPADILETAPEATMSSVLRSAMSASASEESTAVEPPSLLFLSGGSQHGAFGAGVLAGWQANGGGRLPRFQTVTGISTGAILATFAFIDRPDVAAREYAISKESELLIPFVKLDPQGKLTKGSYLKLARKGAVADLSPLKDKLLAVLDRPVMEAVAARAAEGRKLLVGVVDVDQGQAVALDLTDLAQRYFAPRAGETPESVRSCYADAIVASSSAPMAAQPVFLDNRMYVDGGVRFGAFSDEIGQVIGDSEAAFARSRAAAPTPRARAEMDAIAPETYLIVNGDQEIAAQCGKVGKPTCEPSYRIEGAHADWNFLDLALRSEQILVNQVYRFSADRIRLHAGAAGGHLHFALIGPDKNGWAYTFPPGDPLDSGTRTCDEWRQRDRELLNPIQFFPRYMRCLIDYGRAKGRAFPPPIHQHQG